MLLTIAMMLMRTRWGIVSRLRFIREDVVRGWFGGGGDAIDVGHEDRVDSFIKWGVGLLIGDAETWYGWLGYYTLCWGTIISETQKMTLATKHFLILIQSWSSLFDWRLNGSTLSQVKLGVSVHNISQGQYPLDTA